MIQSALPKQKACTVGEMDGFMPRDHADLSGGREGEGVESENKKKLKLLYYGSWACSHTLK